MDKGLEQEIIDEAESNKNSLMDLEASVKKLELVFGREFGEVNPSYNYDVHKSIDQVAIKFDELIAALGDAISDFENNISDMKCSGVYDEREHATY